MFFLSLHSTLLVRKTTKKVALLVCRACFNKLSRMQKLGEMHITGVNLDSRRAETVLLEHR